MAACKKAKEVVQEAGDGLSNPTQAASPPPPAPAPANVAPSDADWAERAECNRLTYQHWSTNHVLTYQTAVVWTLWTGSSTACTVANTWPLWNQNWTITSTTTTSSLPGDIIAGQDAAGRRISGEEARRLLERRTEVERRVRAELDAAKRRAEDLLRTHLTEEQRKDLDQKNCFFLETITNGPKRSRRRRYRIDRGIAGNVYLLDAQGSITGRYCIHPHDVPAADAMLAQKLWLETNEEEFLRVANFTPYDDSRAALARGEPRAARG